MKILNQNLTNHFFYLIDTSGSMQTLIRKVEEAIDSQVQNIREVSKNLNQETRVSVYTFDDDTFNHVFDMDVTRYDTIKNKLQTKGLTALLDCVYTAAQDARTISQVYSEHAFVFTVITDGGENASKKFNRFTSEFKRYIESCPNNFTFTALVPDKGYVNNMLNYGFEAGNVAVWETTVKGIQEQSNIISQSMTNFMQTRSANPLIKKSSNYFQVNTVNVTKTDARKAGTILKPEEFYKLYVSGYTPAKTWISKFVESANIPYKLGKAYYQLTKPEKIQPNKNIILHDTKNGTYYYGPYVRQLLKLPDYEVKVSPGEYGDWVIYVQSTSINRHLQPDTNLIVLK